MAIITSLQDLFEPLLFMAISISHVPQTVADIVASRQLWKLFSISAFKETLFGHFWSTMGPNVKAAGEQRVIPLLEGRITGGRIYDHVVTTPVQGTVIEVGAGSGMWADVFARIGAGTRFTQSNGDRQSNPSEATITKIYGVEPNPRSAAALRQRVKAVGLEDVYEVVPVGIEALSEPGAWADQITPGSVDCIAGVLCLCSIPDPERNIKHLYKLLKPGGRWYVYEHVRATRGGLLLQLYQRLVSVPWAFLIGGCQICRDTEKSLIMAGPWANIDLIQPPGEGPCSILPHIIGILTK